MTTTKSPLGVAARTRHTLGRVNARRGAAKDARHAMLRWHDHCVPRGPVSADSGHLLDAYLARRPQVEPLQREAELVCQVEWPRRHGCDVLERRVAGGRRAGQALGEVEHVLERR